jgi:hypothetical protein
VNSSLSMVQVTEDYAAHLNATFGPIKLTPNLATQSCSAIICRNGVPMFFDSASSTDLPGLYICSLSRKCAGTCATASLLYQRQHTSHPAPPRWQPGWPSGAAADSSVGRGNGSRLYEINLWMWRGQSLKVTVAEAAQRRRKRLPRISQESSLRR